jgi:MFS transporter, Spinster family, sphingosine-1-phosphate transporter
MQGDRDRRGYLLNLLMVILAFNYVDRLALGLLLQDIKLDLDLSDTQLGFMSGIAFAVFYSVMGIPIGRWADRGNRAIIIGVTTAMWSAAVALCGTAANFWQLLLIRIGVAVGEAGCVPPAHSLIADHFTRSERPRAVARYMLGVPLSVLIGYFFAGWLNEFYGWRVTFALLGLPGLVLAVLAWFTLSEPRRANLTRQLDPAGTAASHPTQLQAAPSLKQICLTLAGDTTFRHVLFGFSVIYFFGYGISKWQPAFFVRTYGMQSGELGSWFAVTYGLVGLLGTYLGGELASRYASNNERLQLKAMAILFLGFGATQAAVYLSPNQYTAFGCLSLAVLGFNVANGPLFATIQTLVPEHMRAVSIAIVYLFANLIGMGLGPLATGALSDAFRPWAGEDSLRYALLTLCPGYLWAAWHLWRASKTVTQDLETARARQIGRDDAGAAVYSGGWKSAR